MKNKLYSQNIVIYSDTLYRYMSENEERILSKIPQGFPCADLCSSLFTGEDWDDYTGELSCDIDDYDVDDDYENARLAIIQTIYEDYPELQDETVEVVRQ